MSLVIFIMVAERLVKHTREATAAAEYCVSSQPCIFFQSKVFQVCEHGSLHHLYHGA